MSKEIDTNELDVVNGGFGEYVPEIDPDYLKNQWKEATENPNAKRDKGGLTKIK